MRLGAAPDQNLHTKGLAVAGHQLADAAVAPDAQGLAMQHHAKPEVGGHGGRLQPGLLPGTVLEAGHVLRNAPHRGHHQCPGQLGGRDRRALALANGDAAFGAGVDVDVRTDAAGLCDQFESGQFLHQLPRHGCALPDQYQHVGISQAHRQLADSLDGVGENLGGVGFQFVGAAQLAHSVLIVVKDHDVHAAIVPARFRVPVRTGPRRRSQQVVREGCFSP